MNVNVNPQIFRKYDIRGIYKKDFDENSFLEFSRAFADYLGSSSGKIVVGRDIRDSSEPLSKFFIRGLTNLGIDVLDLGEVTTPMFYFAVVELGAIGGAMITASHNPPEYNGLKFVKGSGMSVSGKEIQKVYSEADTEREEQGKIGRVEKVDISESYLKKISENFELERRVKVKISAEGSSVNLFLPKFLEKLGLEQSEEDLDLSISFDTDGDRLLVFDEKGEKMRGDVVGGIIADSFLKEGDKIVVDIVSTRALREYFEEKNIGVLRSRVGHYFIKETMRKEGAPFASEISGHYYFKHLNYAESALFGLIQILKALNKNPYLKISDMAKPFLKYFRSEVIRIPIKLQGQWDNALGVIKEKYSGNKQSFEDGILVECDNPPVGETSWWFNLRPSNTEPIIKLVVEAATEKTMEKKRDEILALIS